PKIELLLERANASGKSEKEWSMRRVCLALGGRRVVAQEESGHDETYDGPGACDREQFHRTSSGAIGSRKGSQIGLVVEGRNSTPRSPIQGGVKDPSGAAPAGAPTIPDAIPNIQIRVAKAFPPEQV